MIAATCVLLAVTAVGPTRADTSLAPTLTPSSLSTSTAPSNLPSLTLAEALRTARAEQPTLHQAQSARLLAAAQADSVRASLLPQINGSAAYSRGTANFVAPAGTLPDNTVVAAQTVTSFRTEPFFRFGVTASQLIWDFGETLNGWKAAKTISDAQAQSVRVTEMQVAYNVRVAFFTARAAKDMVDVAKATLANQEKHLGQIQGFVQLGRNPEIDLTQARADRATARVALINAENTYDVSRAQLNLAMGVERSVDYQLSDDGLTGVDGEDADPTSLVDEAVKARPEMANLQLLLTGRELSLKSTRDEHFPALGFTTGLTDNGTALDQLVWNWSGALTLTVPIFQGGNINAQVRQSEAQLIGVRAQLDGQRQQVRLDVEQARLNIRAAKALIEAADDAVANTRDRLRLAEGRYQTGVGSIIELGDAQVAQTAAAVQRVQAEYQLFTARAQLLKALGRT
ncbi:MAG TPA: TolC family protein [Polyangia bacterium]|jgi:outer membrane protein